MGIIELLRQAATLSSETQSSLTESAAQISQLKKAQQNLSQLANGFYLSRKSEKEGVT